MDLINLLTPTKNEFLLKVMEIGQLMTDILVNVYCKFEMYIFKIAQVINENVRIAFLYVRGLLFKFVDFPHCSFNTAFFQC